MATAHILQHLRKSAERHARLSQQDEVVLGRHIQRWQKYPLGPENAPPDIKRLGKASLDRFVLANQRLAIHLAQRYADRTSVPIEDLVMAATEGLITAYQRFDPSLGYRSSSYATWYAVSRLQAVCHEMGTPIKLTGAIYSRLRKLERIAEELQRTLGRRPSTAELVAASGFTDEQIQQVQQALIACNPVAIDSVAGDQDERPRGVITTDRILAQAAEDECPMERQERHQTHARLKGLVVSHPDLTPQQRHILQCRYLSDEPKALPQVALELNLSRDRVRTLEAKALTLLKKTLSTTSPHSCSPTPSNAAPVAAAC
jgi:RNA polymerase nonessential primary-like sigma factor